MRDFIRLMMAAILITLVSCEKDGTTFPEYGNGLYEDLLINNDPAALNNRIELKKNALVHTFNDPESDEKGMPASSINIQLIGSLESPLYKEEVLQASHIRITDGYAYIGYNTQGPRYLGGVDIVDVNPATDPQLISNVIFINQETNAGKDVSSIDIEPKSPGGNNCIWIAGAEEGNPLLQSPALVERFVLNSSNQFEKSNNQRQYFDLKGYAGTDVRWFEDKIYVTSGTGGGLTVLNNQLTELNFYSIENARSIDVNMNYTISLGGNPGHLYAPGLWDISVGGATDPEAKSIVRLCYVISGGTVVTKGINCHYNFALAALGEDGLKCFNLDLSATEPASTLPRPMIPDGGNEFEYVTNGVSIAYGGWVYIANGAGGLDIAKMDRDGKMTWLGNINLGSSVNFVEASQQYVFAATGTGGLKILKVTMN